MRNLRIEEVMNGWKVIDLDKQGGYFDRIIGQVHTNVCEYVFSDWSEMMEFIEDYFADEEE